MLRHGKAGRVETGCPQGLWTEGKEDAWEQVLEDEAPRGERPSRERGWDSLLRKGGKDLPGRGVRGSQESDVAGDRGEILNDALAPPSTPEKQQGETGLCPDRLDPAARGPSSVSRSLPSSRPLV